MSDNEATGEIPAWAAREARDELERAITHTGGGETGAAEANTPLSEARQRVEEQADAQEKLDEFTVGAVLAMVDKVAEKRNVDVSGADPLIDQTFQARGVIDAALLEEVDDA